jgi:hypothetical protein
MLIAYNKKMSTNVRTYKDDEIEMLRTFMTQNLQRANTVSRREKKLCTKTTINTMSH